MLFTTSKELIIDLGKNTEVSQLLYLPDQSDAHRGLIHSYTISACDAKGNVIKTLKSDEFSNIQNNPILQTVTFPATTTRFLKLSADRMVKDGEQIGIAELGVK
uniref:discoidin domain-containing protein n=1 Tax=Prevotella sp. TaxID=59823 RepID=UPI004027FC62